ncbi:serine/threonine-protein kinase PINK1, mitochondrial [Ceratina calcarata]|uniref:non-specific serine/threonine protein kinase n=1 Tax=Ceratina calcarata TaxID=156304 RepID=A0AAJ7J0T8_9HYME|nr:serine/threonine-protein kinase PINK1, mitochondrial [Ceratina calcarata]
MSIRTVAYRLVQNGRALLHSVRNTERFNSNFHPRKYHDKIHVVQVGKSQGYLPQGNSYVSNAGRQLGYLGAHARRIFVDNILKRVTNSLAADLRRRAASRLVFGGDSAPFFALVGVSLASGTGILTKDDELEGVCWEIREAISKLQWNAPQNDKNYEAIKDEERAITLNDLVIGPAIAKGCSAVVYAAKFNDSVDSESRVNIDDEPTDVTTFPLALKMMFNYDAESNALSILRAMYRETVPARRQLNNQELADWELRMAERKTKLPPHPNIVAMYYVFADRVPALPGSWGMYPDALPARINPHGSGRNMSLFLLMKRYDVTLKQYLNNRSLNTRESILLLAQLLEGVTHLNAYGIAHRDLKSDNILLDLSEETDNCPSLVITDFGCCLADKRHGLYMPYNTHDIDKGGNVALMAPEVITADPGPFTSINYTKADLWTVGTIAYELFGAKNPFHGEKSGASLKNHDYKEADIPPLPSHVAPIISALIKNLLSRSLYKRLDTETAATVAQLHLWAPSVWLRTDGKLPSSNEILQWLLCLTTKVLCEGRNSMLKLPEALRAEEEEEHDGRNNIYNRSLSTRSCGRRTMPEYQLIASFLGRVTLGNVRTALKWIQQNV